MAKRKPQRLPEIGLATNELIRELEKLAVPGREGALSALFDLGRYVFGSSYVWAGRRSRVTECGDLSNVDPSSSLPARAIKASTRMRGVIRSDDPAISIFTDETLAKLGEALALVEADAQRAAKYQRSNLRRPALAKKVENEILCVLRFALPRKSLPDAFERCVEEILGRVVKESEVEIRRLEKKFGRSSERENLLASYN